MTERLAIYEDPGLAALQRSIEATHIALKCGEADVRPALENFALAQKVATAPQSGNAVLLSECARELRADVVPSMAEAAPAAGRRATDPVPPGIIMVAGVPVKTATLTPVDGAPQRLFAQDRESQSGSVSCEGALHALGMLKAPSLGRRRPNPLGGPHAGD